MSELTLEFRSRVPASALDLHAWHARTGALQRLQPPWERVEVLEQSGGIETGAIVRLRARVGPAWTEWRMRHEEHLPGAGFTDVMESGPFAAWRHEHRFAPVDADHSELVDRIRYRLPLGALGRWVGGRFARRAIERMFRYRHAVTKDDLAFRGKNLQPRPMRILVTGATGVIGSALLPMLTTQGHETVTLSRSARPGSYHWNPADGVLDAAALEGADAVVHLSGSNIASGRWTDARRKEILDSRVKGTRLLVDALSRLERRPEVFLSASAIGYYGDRGDEVVAEDAPAGSGFLADVCRQWEGEAARAAEAGLRTVMVRTGVVLTPAGGALAKVLPVFRAGLGGAVGGGRQWMSWVSIDDLLGIILFCLFNRKVSGPVNAVAPEPTTNGEFASTLGSVLGRPTVAPVPAAVLKLMYGTMAEETVLASTRVAPRRLLEAGYAFRHSRLEPALRHVLGQWE